MKSGPSKVQLQEVAALLDSYREFNSILFNDLCALYCPSIARSGSYELKKMIELSTKMTLVGHGCAKAAGVAFTYRRKLISALYGGCCFLADSFIDDYGETVALRYIDRFERLLTTGWFEVTNEREQLFWIIISRLFGLCNLFDPMLRQAIFSLFLAQRKDIMLRSNSVTFRELPRRKQLDLLKTCARDRSGHGIAVLAHAVAPSMSASIHHHLYFVGALIMYIDDHGDCWADRTNKRITYMNQIARPEKILASLFMQTISVLPAKRSAGQSFELLSIFLYRYFITRLDKYKAEKRQGGLSWSVYE